MKVELLVNLGNFQNIKIISNDDKGRLDGYEEILPYVEDWISFTEFALPLVNHIRKILSLDPYEVENEGLVVTQEVEIKKKVKKLPKGTKKIDTSKVYNYRYTDGRERRCNKCQELLSFDDFNRETHPYGTHVDKDGHIVGDGECTLWEGEV